MTEPFSWPAPIRAGHWLLAATTGIAWFNRHASGSWHEGFGYAVLFIVLCRVVAGLRMPAPYAFRSFLTTPLVAMTYARTLIGGAVARHRGHNPLGGWMVVTLLTLLGVVCLSGWMYTTDRFWGIEWVGNLHAWSSDILLVCIALHISGVLFSSWRENQNLIATMIRGRKTTSDRPPRHQ